MSTQYFENDKLEEYKDSLKKGLDCVLKSINLLELIHEEDNSVLRKGELLQRAAVLLFHLQKYNSAIDFYQQANQIYQALQGEECEKCYQMKKQIANLQYLLGNYDDCEQSYQTTIKYQQDKVKEYYDEIYDFNNIPDYIEQEINELALANKQLADIKYDLYQKDGNKSLNIPIAISYYQSAQKYYTMVQNEEKILKMIFQIARCNDIMDNDDEAFNRYSEYIQKLEEKNQSSEHMIQAFNYTGTILRQRGQPEDALVQYQKGIDLIEKIQCDKEIKVELYKNIGELHFDDLCDNKKALLELKKAQKCQQQIISDNFNEKTDHQQKKMNKVMKQISEHIEILINACGDQEN